MEDMHSKTIKYDSGHNRAKWLLIFFGIGVVLSAVAIVSSYIEIDLLNRLINGVSVTNAEADANDLRQGLIGGVQIILYIVTIILFCLWIYRAYRNLPSLGASGLKYSPGWAVGSFFVPILSLFRPYQIAQEIWKASDFSYDVGDSLAWQKARASQIIVCWWILWILSSIIGQVILRIAFRAETLSDLLTSSWLTLISDAVDIPTVILAMMMIWGIDIRQTEKYKRISNIAIQI